MEQLMEHERNEIDGAETMLPGFRFHPTDEELVGFYLRRKVQHKPLSIELIKQLDIYKYDPWDLPKMGSTGEKEWYFFCPRDRKYRNSTRPNRVTGAGFWKATGTDRPVHSSDSSRCIGLKKSLVFYKGRAAKGTKTDWMMHEFRLPSSSTKNNLDQNIPPHEAWAICRIFKKASTINAQRALSLSHTRSWISPASGNSITSDITTNPNLNYKANTHLCGDYLQQYSSMAATNATFSLLNSQWPSYSTGVSEPAAVAIDSASSLLLDMSSASSAVGGADFCALATEEPCNGVMSAVGTESVMTMQECGGVGVIVDEEEWGMMRFPSYSNLVWDSSPCPSELSSAYSTTNCYT